MSQGVSGSEKRHVSHSAAAKATPPIATTAGAGSPRFSVLMANYCNGRYLKAAIESVIRQSYQNWELIVVDDGSTDDSLAVLSQWKEDPRIRVISHSANRGAGAAFATAAEKASGEIMGMLGADDALRLDALEKMVEAHLQKPSASLINSDLILCDADLVPMDSASPYGPLPRGKSLIHDCPISSFATFKRSAYVRTCGFDLALRSAVDHDLYLKLEEVGELSYVAEPMYFYRLHTDGISQGPRGFPAAQSALLARANAYGRRKRTRIPNLTPREYRALMSTYHRRQATLVGNTGGVQAFSHWLQALKYGPQIVLTRAFWTGLVRHVMRSLRSNG